MALPPNARRFLIVFPFIWCVVAGGMYLWSLRGTLGFEGTAINSVSVPVAIIQNGGPLSSTLELGCSVPTPLRVNHTYQMECSGNLLPPTGTLGNPIEVGLNASGNGFLVSPTDVRFSFNNATENALGALGLLISPTVARFEITPKGSGNQNLLIAATAGGITRTAQWTLDIELAPLEIVLSSALFAFPLSIIYWMTFDALKARNREREITQERIERAESKAEQAPEKAKFAWELAAARLEAYFDRNLSQVSQVFWLAVVVTVVGFAFVLWGVTASLNQPQFTARAIIAGAAGVISEFIGVTFLVIYKSIMAQANEFIVVLERINTVGMAVQILDSIPDDQVELKNSTRSNLVALLVGANPSKNATPGG